MTVPSPAAAAHGPAFDPDLLDDGDQLEALDLGGMLRAVATAGPQVREALTATREADLGRIFGDGRPRAVVVSGVGGSGVAGDVLAACTGVTSATAIHVVKGFGLPGWVGPLDLVAAVSASGATEETLVVAEEAARRGARLVTIGAPGSALARLSEQAGAAHVAVATGARPSRASLWSLSVPLLLLADGLGLVDAPDPMFARTADRLDRLAQVCGPGQDTATNPAKALAAALADALPLIWGSGELGEAAAYRFASQLAENAKVAALHGALPEVGHSMIAVLDGRLARSSGADDFFRDRLEDSEPGTHLAVVLLRDSVEPPGVMARRRGVRAVADARDVPIREIVADGASTLERLASLVGVCDYASVYVALATGIDPTPTGAVSELKRRTTL